MNKKIQVRMIIGVLLLAVLVLSLYSCGKSVKATVIINEKSAKTRSTSVEEVVLRKGEKFEKGFETLKIKSIGSKTVTYSFNGEEVTVPYGEIHSFNIVVMDYGTFNCQVTINKN